MSTSVKSQPYKRQQQASAHPQVAAAVALVVTLLYFFNMALPLKFRNLKVNHIYLMNATDCATDTVMDADADREHNPMDTQPKIVQKPVNHCLTATTA